MPTQGSRPEPGTLGWTLRLETEAKATLTAELGSVFWGEEKPLNPLQVETQVLGLVCLGQEAVQVQNRLGLDSSGEGRNGGPKAYLFLPCRP